MRLGIDLGGTKIAVGVVDASGRVLSRQQAPTQTAGAWPQALPRIVGMLRQAAAEAGVTIAGIGIGSTGPVDPLQGKFENLDTMHGETGGDAY